MPNSNRQSVPMKFLSLVRRGKELNRAFEKSTKKQERLSKMFNKQAEAMKKRDWKTVDKLGDKISKLSNEIKRDWNKTMASPNRVRQSSN